MLFNPEGAGCCAFCAAAPSARLDVASPCIRVTSAVTPVRRQHPVVQMRASQKFHTATRRRGAAITPPAHSLADADGLVLLNALTAHGSQGSLAPHPSRHSLCSHNRQEPCRSPGFQQLQKARGAAARKINCIVGAMAARHTIYYESEHASRSKQSRMAETERARIRPAAAPGPSFTDSRSIKFSIAKISLLIPHNPQKTAYSNL